MRRVIFALLAILFLCAPALGQERGKTALPVKPQELRRIIYVPREEFMRVVDPARRGRVIEFEEYLRLERLAARRAAGTALPEPVPPLPAVFTGASYRGAAGDTQAAMFARIEFTTLATGWVTLNVRLGGAAIAYPKLDGRDVLIRPVPGGISILVPEKGDHVLHATVFIPVESTPAGKKLTARLPATPASTVTLHFPGKVEIKAASAPTERTYDEARDRTTAEIFLGNSTDLSVTFRPEERRAEMQPFIVAHNYQRTAFDLTGSRTAAQIRVHSHRAKLSSLKINIDSDMQISDLDASEMLDWSRTTSGETTELEIRFRKPVAFTTVDLTLDRANKAKKRALPRIQVPQARAHSWLLGVSHAPDTRAEFVSVRNARQRASREPGAKQAHSSLFESQRPDHEIVFEVTPVAPKVESVILEALDIRRERILLDVDCFWKALRGRVYSFTARLPKNWEILQVEMLRGSFEYSIATEDAGNVITFTSPLGLHAPGGAAAHIQARLVPGEVGGEKWKGLSFNLPRVELPGSVFAGGTVALRPSPELRLSASGLHALRDMDVARSGLEGATLAYRMIDADYSAEVRAAKREPRLVASVVSALSLRERFLNVSSLVMMDILESPIDSFKVRLPKGTGRLVQFNGPDIKERTLTEEDGGDLWNITLQKELQGSYQLLVTFDTPIEGESQKLRAPNIEIVGAYRQDGYVVVEAGEGIEIAARARNMEEVYISEVPYLGPVQSRTGTGIFVHAFRYARPDYSLTLEVTKHELAQVVTCIVPDLGVVSGLTADGRERTSALFHVRSVGEQFFSFALPQGAKLWSVLLGRDPGSMLPVKPLSRGRSHLVPLTAAPGQGTDYYVKAVYEREHKPLGLAGSLTLDVPRVPEGPVISLTYATYVPEGYRYYGHAGAASYILEVPVGETVFDGLFYPVFILALIALGIYALVLGVRVMPKVRIAPSLPRRLVTYLALLMIIAILAAIAVPNLLESKRSANEASSISCLRTLSSAQELFRTRYGRYGTLRELGDARMIDGILADGSKQGYNFELHAESNRWYAYARPGVWGTTGTREFYIDQTGVIQYSGGRGEKFALLGRERAETAGGERAMRLQKGGYYEAESGTTPAPPRASQPLEKPVVALEEEAKIAKDIPKGTSFDNLSNKNLDFTSGVDKKAGKDFIFLQDGQRLEGRLAGRGKNAIQLVLAGGAVQNVPLGEVDSIRHANGAFEQVGARKDVSRRGVLSMLINLRPSGRKGDWSALSGGGIVTMSYVSIGVIYTICFILTFASMFIFMALERKSLALKVLYVAVLVIIFGSLPAVLGSHHYAYCNAVLLGLLLGIAYYQARNLIAAIRERCPRVLIAASLLALALALFLQPQTAWAQEETRQKKLPPIKPADLVVPYDTKDLKRAVGKGQMVLSEQRYMELLERAGLVKRKVQKRPPVDSCISSAHFEATLLADRVDIQATYAISVLARGERKVELGLNGLAISHARLDGEPAMLIVGKPRRSAAGLKSTPGQRPGASSIGGYALMVRGPRTARLSLTFSMPRDPEKTSGSLSFKVVPVAASVVDVRTGLDTDVKIRSAMGGQTEEKGKSAKLVQAVLGPLGEVGISWQPHRAYEAGLGLHTVVSSELLYRIDSDAVFFDGSYAYTVRGGELEAVSFTVPEGLEIFRVHGAKLRLWRLIEGDERVLEVVLQPKPGRTFNLSVSGVSFPPGGAAKYSLPVPAARQVQRDMGTVVITPQKDMALQVTKRRGLRQSVRRGARRAADGYAIHSTYTYTGTPWELEVLPRPRETDLRADTFALLMIGTEQSILRVESDLESAGRPVYNLAVSVPADFEVRRVVCAGMVSYFVHREGGAQRIHLEFESALSAKCRLVIEGVRKAGAVKAKEAIPVISIAPSKRHRGEVAVAAEPGLMVSVGELAGIRAIAPAKVRRLGRVRSLLGLSRVQQAFSFAQEGYSGELLVTQLEPELSVMAITALTVRSEVLAYAAIVEYGIEHAACQEFRLRVPERVRKSLSIRGAFLREKIFSEPDEEGFVEVTVKLQHDVLENYSLVLRWEADPEEGKSLTVPVVQPLGAKSWRAYVVVQATADLRFYQGDFEKVEVIDSSEVPHLNKFEVGDARVLLSCKVLEFPYTVSYELERLKKAAEIEAIIDNAEYTVVVNRSAYSYNRASFHIQNRAKQYLKLRMPEGAVLWTADVAGVPVKPARLEGQDGQIVLIPLLKRSEEDISYFVSVYYGAQLPGGFGLGGSLKPVLAEPLEIQVEESYVSVYLPERYSYSFDTNMDEVIGSVKEVAKGQTTMLEFARLSKQIETETDPGIVDKLTSSLEELNYILAGQLASAKKGQKSASRQIGDRAEFAKQYDRNVDEIRVIETGLTENTAYARHARARQKQLQQQFRAEAAEVDDVDIYRDDDKQRYRRAGRHVHAYEQDRLNDYVQQQEKQLKTQMKQRDVSATTITWKWDDEETEEAGFETPEGEKKEFDPSDAKKLREYLTEQKRGKEEMARKMKSEEERRIRGKRDEPMKRPVRPQAEFSEVPLTEPEGRQPVSLPPKMPEADAKPGTETGAGRAGAGEFRPARAAGVQPLKIDLPERGVALHFKKLGRDPKLTLYSSSAVSRARWAYAVRMLVALGLLAFCVWQGVSLFGAKSTGRAVLEGAVALVVIVLVLGSTAFALVGAGAVGLYIGAKYSGYLRRWQRA